MRHLAGLAIFALAASARADDAADFFEAKVRPVLVEHCQKCHGGTAGKEPKGGLRLFSRQDLLTGGETGPAIVSGKGADSLLVKAMRWQDADLQMPPKQKLSEAMAADVARWIDAGAVWPGDAPAAPPENKGKFPLAERKATHWAWKPVADPKPPAVKDQTWPRDPIDNFILAGLEAKNLKPAARADRVAWVRRVSFLLVGLPPTPEEVADYVRDSSPGAEAKVVDRVLASEAFGERFARHWMDLARYAESRGHEFDPDIPNPYLYRDYLIRAFNADVPYTQFAREQVAGDLFAEPRLDPKTGANESLTATAFWHLGEEVHSPVDARQDQADRFDNRIDVFSKTFLGLTVACARCHDHKFDAISTADYYSLFATLEGSSYRQARIDHWTHNRTVAAERNRSLAALQLEWRAALDKAAEGVKPAEVAPYLVAAADLIREGAAKNKTLIEQRATEAKLDAKKLGEWVVLFAEARTDPAHPFHAWVHAAAVPEARFAAARSTAVTNIANARKNSAKWRADSSPVLDFSRPEFADFVPDDVTFGAGPLAADAISFDAVGKPIITPFAAAAFDLAYKAIGNEKGIARDFGGVSYPRTGLSLRTRAMTLTKPFVASLVRGPGRAYYACSQHTIIAGPLHGSLVRNFPAPPEGWRWEVADLRPYIGQPMHVEWTADANAPFALAAVYQCDNYPPAEYSGVDYAPALAGDNRGAAAENYLTGLLSPSAARDNLLIGHGDLFGVDPSAFVAMRAKSADEMKATATAFKPLSRTVPALWDGPKPFADAVFVRGSPKSAGEAVSPRTLEAFGGTEHAKIATGSGRRELAERLPDNPLFARVMANRVWHWTMGRGVSASTDNFGLLGEPPTNPELLDHLTQEFIRGGYSVKKLIRRVALSSAFAIGSTPDAAAIAADPANALWHYRPPQRLDGESIRDAILSISGRLDRRIGGPSVLVHLTPFLDGRGRPASGPIDGNGRRSLYIATRRNFLSPWLMAFDAPTPFSTVGRRQSSNVPAQALTLMNDPFVHEQAGLWAKRILATKLSDEGKVEMMYRQAFSRPPTAEELARCRAFLAGADPADAWKELGHALWNAKEFVFLK